MIWDTQDRRKKEQRRRKKKRRERKKERKKRKEEEKRDKGARGLPSSFFSSFVTSLSLFSLFSLSFFPLFEFDKMSATADDVTPYAAGEIVTGVLCVLSGLSLALFGLRLHKPTFLFAGLFWGFWISFFVARVHTPPFF